MSSNPGGPSTVGNCGGDPAQPAGNHAVPAASHANDCPSNETLQTLVAGELPADLEFVVSRHLESCPACERMALQISDDRSTRALLAEHRRGAASDNVAATELDEIRERLHVLSWLSQGLPPGAAKAPFDDGTQAGAATSRAEERPAPTVGKFEIV